MGTMNLSLPFISDLPGRSRVRTAALAGGLLASAAAAPVATRGRRTSTRRLRARPAAVALLVRGSSAASPGGLRRSGATPACAKARTTDAARAADSSQLDGNAAVWIGTGSVWPSHADRVLVLGAQERADLRRAGRARRAARVAEPQSKNSLSVSSRMTRPRR